ncbi:MAG: alanine racemase [Alphaproteobacteria bacterium]
MTVSHQPKLTINLSALAQNWRLLNGLSALGSAAVVKANAYGLGVEACAPKLRDAGASRFFVATLSEGRTVRETLGEGPWIGVLEGLSEVAAFEKYSLTPVLNTLEQIKGWRGHDQATIHVDTGMNRLGLQPQEVAEGVTSDTWKNAKTAILMSHLASAEEPENPSNAAQLKAFREAMASASNREFIPSLINSSGHFLGDDYLKIGMGRPGLALYGGNPTPDAAENPMNPVVQLHAPLIQLRTVEAGAPVGYGGTWVAQRESHLGVIPLGYADGWPRAASDRVMVRLGQSLCPQVGRVSMDTAVLDLTDAPAALRRIGEPVEVIGGDLTVDRFAQGARTISYEILTSLSRRAKRAYLSH